MQALYAYKQAESSSYTLATDQITEAFAPDLNAAVQQDPRKLEGNTKLGILLFEENYLKGSVPADEEVSEEVRRAVNQAIAFYDNQLKKDRKYLALNMVRDAEKIYDRYIQILLLPVELADAVAEEEEKQQNRQIKPSPSSQKALKLTRNQVIEALRNNKALETEVIRRGVSWHNDQEFVRKLYKDVLKVDPEYMAYQQLPEASFEEDQKIVLHIVKAIIFKHPEAEAFFDSQDLYWSENEEILKSMVVKTLKSADSEEPTKIELSELAKNWEEDVEFFKDIYNITLDHDREYDELISNKIQNWDVERIALTDQVMLKMALAEMLEFPSIPVKVTINEYIELAKLYSTPKSKQFINGLLDALAIDLTAKGILRKSGRGLIDNR
jgi:N utilization substance protein B